MKSNIFTYTSGQHSVDLKRGFEIIRFLWTEKSNIIDIHTFDLDPSRPQPVIPLPMQVFQKRNARTYWDDLISRGYAVRVRKSRGRKIKRVK